jgi:hypothetical protein
MVDRVSDIEQHLQALDEALSGGVFAAIERASACLQSSLSEAVKTLARPGSGASLDADLRRRLTLAKARAGHQQLAVHRVAASLERTLAVLLPHEQTPATFGAMGHSPTAKALQAYR